MQDRTTRSGTEPTQLTVDADRWGILLEAAHRAGEAFLSTLPSRPAAAIPEPPAPDHLPRQGIGAEAALARFRERYEKNLSGSAGPRYLGFVTGGSTPASVVGDWLVAAYDQNLSNDGDSVATAVELETVGFLRQLFGLPESFAGVFVSGATMANATALATARQWAGERLGVDIAEEGLSSLHRIPVLGGAPHASIFKALAMLGWGRRAVEILPRLPGRRTVDPTALDRRLAEIEGPAVVVASAGEVNTGDFDDIAALAEITGRHGAWLHVDGAFGLFAVCDPERRHLLRGVEHADSIATDGHKWLNVPYDSGLVFCRRPDLQKATFRAAAAYLGDRPDLMHLTPENSRRFRALPAWMSLIAYGADGYRQLVRTTCELAHQLGERIEASNAFDLLAPVPLNIVCFALQEGDAERRDHFLRRLQEDGRTYLTPTVWEGRPAIRAAFSSWSTTPADLETIWEALCDAEQVTPPAGR